MKRQKVEKLPDFVDYIYSFKELTPKQKYDICSTHSKIMWKQIMDVYANAKGKVI